MSLFTELKRRNVLRVAAGYVAVAWLAIQIAETLFPMFGLSDAAARSVVIALAIGFIPVLVLAWIFELTPEGLKRDAEVDHGAPGARELGKRFDRLIVVVLVLAVTFFAFDKFVLDPTRDVAREAAAEQRGRSSALVESYGEKSIAVLPFLNMSSDPEQEYFSDGIAEELLNLLAQVKELRVISRSSAFSFKGKNIEIPEIAERLNVEHVLEGSVRKSGNKIRITAQLIEAHSDTHLWSQTYDREIGDIFAIQDEIAADVVSHLKVTLLGEMPTVSRTNPVAHALTLQARALAFKGNDSYGEARLLLEEALRQDPGYVPALYYLSVILYWEASFAHPFDPAKFEENQRLASELDNRALQIDPDHPSVLSMQGWINFETYKDFQKAAILIERAVQIAPGDAEVLRIASSFAQRIGHANQAVELSHLLQERDPLCRGCGQNWFIYLEAGRYDEAIAARLEYKGDGVSFYSIVLAALLNGDPQMALDYVDTGNLNDFDLNALRAMALNDLGRDKEAQAALDRQIADWGENAPDTVAMVMAWMGDTDTAFEMLYERYWPQMYGFHREVFNPIWVSLHDDPRWIALREKSGYTEEAFAVVEFNPVLPD